ncbi:hypothetical protein E2562_025828 [Oryza meyeriana var. granulata]|uniref:Uncharacterized protein n=1 Tax=Oryza meyeriana var. granulata TaxID=110450 RepID=A0A6G1E2I2_9ORYZ|nr:hypothetical protein E2562_025828 [Oryza meyeriana var. granulata]
MILEYLPDYNRLLVKPCRKSSEEDKEKCKKAIDDSKKDKKARYAEQQEVRDTVDLVGAPDADEDTTAAKVEEIDCSGGNDIRKIGHMDKLTWKLIEEACGVEECGKLRRSARLAQMREVNEDEIESEVEEATNEEDIDFESDQEDVVPLVGDDEKDGDNE